MTDVWRSADDLTAAAALDALREATTRPQSTPVVHVHVPKQAPSPAPIVHVAAPEAPVVNVTLPDSKLGPNGCGSSSTSAATRVM